MTCVPTNGFSSGTEGPEADAFTFGGSSAAVKTMTNLALLWSVPAMAMMVMTGEMMGGTFRR